MNWAVGSVVKWRRYAKNLWWLPTFIVLICVIRLLRTVNQYLYILMMFFWVKAPCGLVSRNQRFGEACCLNSQPWKMEKARPNPKERRQHRQHREKASHTVLIQFSDAELCIRGSTAVVNIRRRITGCRFTGLLVRDQIINVLKCTTSRHGCEEEGVSKWNSVDTFYSI
jgi:hypothetical protein